jgi:small subunit ribosomal protein S16
LPVRIRLKRFGSKNRAQWRVVVADGRSPRDGRFIEQVGSYNPLTDPADVRLKLDRIDDWISKGALPTDTVKSLVKRAKKTQKA